MHSPGLVEHLHMRKAGGTTLRMNVAAGCRPCGVQVVEQEWGAFRWNAAATRAKQARPALTPSVFPAAPLRLRVVFPATARRKTAPPPHCRHGHLRAANPEPARAH